MIGREYLARQTTTLLKLASLVKDPNVAAGLTGKAADLKSRSDDAPPVSDVSLLSGEAKT